MTRIAAALCVALLAAPASAQAPQERSVRALLQQARAQAGQGNVRGALESLTAARTLAPSSEEVLSAFAQVALRARLPLPAILSRR